MSDLIFHHRIEHRVHGNPRDPYPCKHTAAWDYRLVSELVVAGAPFRIQMLLTDGELKGTTYGLLLLARMEQNERSLLEMANEV